MNGHQYTTPSDDLNYYDNYLDIDDNDYYIRKYSDDNIPIYNKRLTPSPTCIKEEILNNETHYYENTSYNAKIYSGIKIVIGLQIIIIPFIYYVSQYH